MKRKSPFQKIADAQKKQAELTHDETGAFNPVVDQDQIKKILRGSMPGMKARRAFNEGGEVNASNTREAAQVVASILNSAAAQEYMQPDDTGIDVNEANQILRTAATTEEGMRYIAQESVDPIKDVLDYRGMARSMLKTVNVPNGTRHFLQLDVRATAAVINGRHGKSVQISQPDAEYVEADRFTITSNAKMSIVSLHEARFDMLSRIQDTMRQEIEREEDKRFIALVDTSAQIGGNTNVAYSGAPSVGVFEAMKYQIEKHPKNVGAFMMHRLELSNLINSWAGNPITGPGGSPVDFVTQREVILSGWVGNVLGVPLKITAGSRTADVVIPTGRIYAVAPKEELGEFGVHIDLMAEPYTLAAQGEPAKGFLAVEHISMVIPRAYSCVRAVRS
jgi:HK97 family phage major capsid protein